MERIKEVNEWRKRTKNEDKERMKKWTEGWKILGKKKEVGKEKKRKEKKRKKERKKERKKRMI